MATLNDNARVEPDDVRSVFTTDLDNDSLVSFINMAAEVVDDVSEADPSVSDQRLRLIEMNLSAHFASSDDPRALQESLGDASFMYTRPREVTEHLKTAATLDPTNVVTVSGKDTANIRVLDGR